MTDSLPITSSDPRDLLGNQLAGFHLTAVLGEGGMAIVFRGENVLDPSLVRAIKVVRPHLAMRPEFVRRFTSEARALDRLQHPNVVRFHGFRRDGVWLVMELEHLEGRALSSAIPRDGRLDPRLAVQALWQASEGVAAAHALGIVHRDLKPENIFITKGHVAKVLDFGLARAVDDADREDRATAVGQVPGTPAYMAPEVCEGAVPDTRADVYALGLTLYEVLLGRHPFRSHGQEAPSALQLMRLHTTFDLSPIGEHVAGLPPGLGPAVARATAKQAARRYASARELGDVLRAVLEGWESTVSNPTDVALPTFRLGTPVGDDRAPGSRSGATRPNVSRRATASSTPWLMGLAAALLGTAGLVAMAAALWGAGIGAPTNVPDVVEAPPPPPDPREGLNPWVRIEPSSGAFRRRDDDRLLLGLTSSPVASAVRGFRPSRGIAPPSVPYLLQRHEVTWKEFDPWLAQNENHTFSPPRWLENISTRDSLPVAAIPWESALAYCRSLGGSLPTEEEWEWAARGEELRPFPWGSNSLDPSRTWAWLGADATPRPVETADQDHTPGIAGEILYDLLGNVQEWTVDVWREDEAGKDESWVIADGGSWKALRGVPIAAAPPSPADRSPEPIASREPMCTAGPCAEKQRERVRFQNLGFRCARPAPRTDGR